MEIPGQMMTPGIFSHREDCYLLISDYYSEFLEVNLPRMEATSKRVNKLRDELARYRFLIHVIFDDVHQFRTTEF